MTAQDLWRGATRFGLTLAMVGTVRCAPEVAAPKCLDPSGELDRSAAPGAAGLPGWAVGEFGYHQTDLVNLRIRADGSFDYFLDGGDYGRCISDRASYADGKVRLPLGSNPTEAFLVKTVDGRFFLEVPAYQCRWQELTTSALCGTDPGGCGGYGGSVPCSFNEAAGGCTGAVGSDGGK